MVHAAENRPPGKSRKPLVIGLLVVFALLIGTAAMGWKMFWYDPQQAPVAYFKKVAAAKTGTVKASVNYKADGQIDGLFGIGSSATLTANGSYDVSDTSNAKVDMNLALKYSQTEIAAHIIALPKAVYFQLTKAGFLSILGLNDSKDWHKISSDEAGGKKAEDKCKPKNDKTGKYFGMLLPTAIPVTNAKRVGLYEQVDGHTVSHFSGTIDFAKLQKVVDAANKGLSADCKIEFHKDDYKDYVVSYDLWTSKQFDRMVLTIKNTGKNAKGTATATIDSSGYNKAVKIEAPKNAKDFSPFGSLGADGDTSVDVSPNTPSARDSQRKSDLRTVKTGLESYFNENSSYPSGDYNSLATALTTGAAPYIQSLPKDPTAGRTYTYTPQPAGCKPGKCTTYTMTARLEVTSDSQAVKGVYTTQSAN